MKLNIRVNWVFFCIQIHAKIGDFDRFKRYKLNDSMAHRLKKFFMGNYNSSSKDKNFKSSVQTAHINET